jgi:hypothetical protein
MNGFLKAVLVAAAAVAAIALLPDIKRYIRMSTM